MPLIPTTQGELDDALLEKRETVSNGAVIVEYYMAGELVHRSIQLGLTPQQSLGADAAKMS